MKGLQIALLVVAVSVGFAAAKAKFSPAAIGDSFRNARNIFPALNGGDRVTRQQQCTQEQMNELIQSYPLDCAIAFGSLDNDTFDLTAIELICQPRCGDPLIEFNRQCYGEEGQQHNDLLVQLCATNEQGVRCYIAAATLYATLGSRCLDAPSVSTCSGLTCSNVQAGVTSVGCCINLADETGGSDDLTDTLEDVCPGIDITDKKCKDSSLSGALPLAAAAGTLLGALAAVVSIVV